MILARKVFPKSDSTEKNAKKCARWWNDYNIEHTLNILWTHSEHTLSTLWAHSEHTLSTLWTHSEHTLITLWTHSEHTLNTLWMYTLNTLWTHSEYTLKTLWRHSEHTLNILWTYSEDMNKIWQNFKNITQWLSNMDPRDASASKKGGNIQVIHWTLTSWRGFNGHNHICQYQFIGSLVSQRFVEWLEARTRVKQGGQLEVGGSVLLWKPCPCPFP